MILVVLKSTGTVVWSVLRVTSNTCWAKNEENQVFVFAGSWPQFFPTIFGVLIGQLLAMRYCWCMFLPVSIHLKNTVKLIHLRMYGLKVNNA